ncbi:sugar transferase [Parapedobacter tibetensis]|uniref:sugar transferase n=1 Tax=Parapedobacter tibetensis TaxID=2972951 RepID=UPI00214DD8E9|nr:sugar transferase [Parapedobacter tibetensis]
MDLLTELRLQSKFLTISIAYLGTKFVDELDYNLNEDIDVNRFDSLENLKDHINSQSLFSVPDVFLLEIEDNISEILSFVLDLRENPLTRGISVILLGFKSNKSIVTQTFSPYVNDIYFYPFNVLNIQERLQFIFKFKIIGNKTSLLDKQMAREEYKMPLAKRFFDIMVSALALLCASPLLVIIALLVKLDSKGPVIYKSERAGCGYKIFDFYKFRSMKVNADKELDKLSALNQYAINGGNSAFIKIKDDPRVTKLGAFLRKTSLDELPQLFNVLKGDMSLVGNRPLPLYEAQLLTSDEWAMRFLGPAGITGLWQVSKRGKSEMSDEERRQLDNYYSKHFSFWVDVKILLKTVPALLQKEAV